MLVAREIMTRAVVSVAPEMSIDEAGVLLVEHRIHGAPVIDEDAQLIGMVSFVDLVGRTGDNVGEVMTPDPVCASEDTPVDELASLMLEQSIRRIPVTRDGRVVGIVSASDIIGLFLNLHERTTGSGARSRTSSRKKSARATPRRPRRAR